MEDITIEQLDQDLTKLEEKVQQHLDYFRNWVTDIDDRLQALEYWAEEQGFKPAQDDEDSES